MSPSCSTEWRRIDAVLMKPHLKQCVRVDSKRTSNLMILQFCNNNLVFRVYKTAEGIPNHTKNRQIYFRYSRQKPEPNNLSHEPGTSFEDELSNYITFSLIQMAWNKNHVRKTQGFKKKKKKINQLYVPPAIDVHKAFPLCFTSFGFLLWYTCF